MSTEGNPTFTWDFRDFVQSFLTGIYSPSINIQSEVWQRDSRPPHRSSPGVLYKSNARLSRVGSEFVSMWNLFCAISLHATVRIHRDRNSLAVTRHNDNLWPFNVLVSVSLNVLYLRLSVKINSTFIINLQNLRVICEIRKYGRL